MSFVAYPSYRDSGVEWIGPVPADWGVCPLLAVAEECDRSNRGMLEDNLLSLSYGSIVRKDINTSDGLLPESFETYQIIEPNDIVWRLTDLQNDKRSLRTAIVRERGIITSAYLATKPHGVLPTFLSYLLRAYDQEKVFYSMGGGLRQSMKYADVRRMPIVIPSQSEQTAIAAFLDRETAKIDALVEAQRRLIELLKEKRQAVISHTVTKGLDPTVPMKDSGVEWLGDVPAHWNTIQLKRLVQFQRGHDLPTQDRREGPVPIVSSGGHIGWHESAMAHGPSIVTGRYGTIGNFALVEGPFWPLNTTLYSTAIHGEPRFVKYSLENLTPLFIVNAGKSAVPGVDRNDLHELLTAVPPASEQLEIAAFLDDLCARHSKLTAEAMTAIEILRERKAALISGAVTGKIDVRTAAQVTPFPVDRARARGLVGTEIIERFAREPTFGRVKLQKIAFLAEAHVGISELGGSYTREAAGPLDRGMINEMENGAHTIAGVTVDQVGGTGTTVSYELRRQRGTSREELANWLGTERMAKLDRLIADFANLTTKGSEAVATLYGVWNDALIAGCSPTDGDIIAGFLNNWHPEKRQKFSADELTDWLEWMRRHGIVPSGFGPETTGNSLFS